MSLYCIEGEAMRRSDEGIRKRSKRRYSIEEKSRVIEKLLMPGSSVAEVVQSVSF
jgi:hypothetical protein